MGHAPHPGDQGRREEWAIKLKLLFKDRVGIVADVSTLIAEMGVNILSMEVDPRDGVASVYLAADLRSRSEEEIFNALGRIPDLREIKFIDTLPAEMRENRFRVVLDNIWDGVVSIDADGHIRTLNRTARIVLGCENTDMIGRHVAELGLPDHAILECIIFSIFLKN